MSKVQYKAVAGARLSDADAEKIGPVLERIAVNNGGSCTPADILAEAKKKRSPLHEYFEWDDSAAAEKYRIEQARYLARSIKIVVESAGEAQEVRALHLVTRDGERGYMPIASVTEDVDLMEQVVDRAKRELTAWYYKHNQLRRLAGLSTVFDQIEREVISPERSMAAE